MQSFILDRHTDPSNPTMKVTQDDKIPIYDSKADAEADLANIEEGGIVATKDTGATEKVVDVVEDGNMNPVTSNAVADLFLFEEDTSSDIYLQSMAYEEWQTDISDTKIGYKLVSFIAMPVSGDAILTNVHKYDGRFRVTVINVASIPQTKSIKLTVVWMKD